MLRKIVSFVLFCILLSANVYAHTAIVEMTGENKYKAIRLTPEIYSNANFNLSDILITDESGENVPYFFNSCYQDAYTEVSRYPMTFINAYIKDDEFYFDYMVSEQPGRDILATSIEFTTDNANFAKSVEVFGSYDNIHWEKAQNDKLFNVDGKSKLEIVFNEQKKYTHYRFKLANNLEKISFNTVELKNSMETNQKSFFIEHLRPKFRTEEKGKTTYIYIEGLKNLRLAEITIDTDSMFQRTVTAVPFWLSKELYNLALNGTTYTDTTMPFDRLGARDEILTLTIDNADDKPINIQGITVKYYADELVFEGGKSGKYTILFGADASKPAPVYDIEKYKNEILQGSIDRLSIQEVVFETPQEKQAPDLFNKIFNIVVIGIAVLLGFLILMKLRKKTSD